MSETNGSNNMQDDNRLPIAVTKGIATAVCVLILTIGGCTVHRDRVFAMNGYEQTTLQGTNEMAWKKAK